MTILPKTQRLVELFVIATIAIGVPLGVQRYLNSFEVQLNRYQQTQQQTCQDVELLREDLDDEIRQRVSDSTDLKSQLTEVQVDVKWLVLHAQGKLDMNE